MATTKTILIEAIRLQLAAVSGVKKAAYILELPDNARQLAPYIGLVAGAEAPVVVDSTHVRHTLNLDLILIHKGLAIDTLIDSVRALMLTTATATTVGALEIHYLGIGQVTILAADDYSQARMRFEILYSSVK
jgi:hypothetical protein